MLTGQRVIHAFVFLLLLVLGVHHPLMMAEAAPGGGAMHARVDSAPLHRDPLQTSVSRRRTALVPEHNANGCACCNAASLVLPKARMERRDAAPDPDDTPARFLHGVVSRAEDALDCALAVQARIRAAALPSSRVRRALLGVFLL